MDQRYGRVERKTYSGPEKFWKKLLRRNRLFLLWFPAMLIYDEIVFRIAVGDAGVGFAGIFYTLVFSIAIGCFLTLISTIFINKINVYIVITLISVITLVFGVQLVYIGQFRDFFRWSTLGLAGDVTQFWREALAQIFAKLIPILFLLVPLVVYCVWGRERAPALGTPLRVKGVLLALVVMFHLTALAGIVTDSDAGDTYNGTFSPSRASGYFGLLTETRLDIKYAIFGEPEFENPGGDVAGLESGLNPFGTESSDPGPGGTEPPSTGGETGEVEPPKPIVYGDNVLDIDWDSLIANEKNSDIKAAHEYFSALTPTKKNEYTGYFEGKNLIQLTLEGFSYKAVEAAPELFPVLSKMLNGGFVLDNYYNSLWGGSTATGEYVSMTGVFYNTAECLKMSANNYWPFTLGRVFDAKGYGVYAFHNHTYTYYGRDKSHPNFGYADYVGIGNSVGNMQIGVKGDDWDLWPRSDLELAKRTVDYYIDNAPFHVYYMTVSGHANYTFGGNNMARRHREEVENLNYSDGVKAYIACQLEVEYMLEYIVERLEAAGQLENTVFVMNADHYPYALEEKEQAELYGLPEKDILGNFDLYRNGAVIYCASMEEPVHITKPCSAIDLIPTVLNLFGVNYDSRLFMGVDLNSTTDPIVVLNCANGYSAWNWINSYGSYNTQTKKFTPAPGVTVDDEAISQYVSQMNSIVATKRKYSLRILDRDYYKYVFPNGISSY